MGAGPEAQVRPGLGEVGLSQKRWGWMASGSPESVPAQVCGPGQTTSFSEPQFSSSVEWGSESDCSFLLMGWKEKSASGEVSLCM